ncbi:hypothetical protein EUA02_26820 [Mycobacterium paragordonae]|nr:hypothetical protein EUA02_26820 [Mycobacterium paragordonae]TDK89670.1 hypothetical protein EI067_25190 [Mycobacterium paragordonae]
MTSWRIRNIRSNWAMSPRALGSSPSSSSPVRNSINNWSCCAGVSSFSDRSLPSRMMYPNGTGGSSGNGDGSGVAFWLIAWIAVTSWMPASTVGFW